MSRIFGCRKNGPDDERSKLIFTFLDVIEKVKPKAFVMENVKALGVLEKWEPVRKKYLDRVSKLGYLCVPFVLNATEYGVCPRELGVLPQRAKIGWIYTQILLAQFYRDL